MKLVRTATALAVGSALVLTGTAGAATTKPAPVCNLLTDDPKDSGFFGPDQDNHQEIVGGDIATNATTLAGVLRLAAAPAVDPISPGGLEYYLEFTVPTFDGTLYLGADMDPTGAMTYNLGTITTDATGATNYAPVTGVTVNGKIDGTNLAMTVALSDVAGTAKVAKGSKITGLAAETFGVVNAVATGALTPFGSDSATGGKTYVAGTPSCILPK